MKGKIYKYPLKVEDLQIVELPKDCIILSVQKQNYNPVLWVLASEENADDTNSYEERTIVTVGTGHTINNYEKLIYLGTVQLSELLVLHIFEYEKGQKD